MIIRKTIFLVSIIFMRNIFSTHAHRLFDIKAINMTSFPVGIYSLRVINQNEQRVETFLNG